MLIVLLHLTGALLLILFILELFCANEPVENVKPIAIKKIDFVTIVLCFKIDDTKVNTNPTLALDKNQEVFLTAFFRNLLKVSGVIPSIEAKYCKGTWLNNSALKLKS